MGVGSSGRQLRILLVVGVMLASVVAMLLAWLWAGGSEPAPPVAEAVPSKERQAPTAEPVDRRPTAVRSEQELTADIAAHEEALMAVIAQSGEGWIRCTLPEDLAGNVDTDDLPFATDHDGVLTMAVKQRSWGRHAWLLEPGEGHRRERLGLAVWGDVTPGEQAECQVYTDTAEVEVEVRFADGTPSPRAMVSSSRGGSVSFADADGLATIELFVGLPTMVSANERRDHDSPVETPMRYGGVMVDAPEAAGRVVVALDAEGTRRILSDSEVAEHKIEDADRALSSADAISAALEQPDLSEAARDVLREWRDTLEAEAEEELDDAEHIAADADGDPFSYTPRDR